MPAKLPVTPSTNHKLGVPQEGSYTTCETPCTPLPSPQVYFSFAVSLHDCGSGLTCRTAGTCGKSYIMSITLSSPWHFSHTLCCKSSFSFLSPTFSLTSSLSTSELLCLLCFLLVVHGPQKRPLTWAIIACSKRVRIELTSKPACTCHALHKLSLSLA